MHIHRLIPFLAFGLSALFCAAPAAAAESAFSVSAEIGLVSDYRFRGVSLSNRKPAVQGGLTIEHESGAYAGTWASTIAKSEGGARGELDFYAGYVVDLGSGFGLDLMLNYYSYPSDSALNYAEAMATLSGTVGIVTPKIGLAFAPAENALVDEDGRERSNSYAFGAVDVALPSTPVTLNAQLGRETGPFDGRSGGPKWDWQIGATAVFGPATLGLAYVDSDLPWPGDGSKDLGAPTVVASLLLSF